MINFSRSTFTWKSHPWLPDAHYRYAGGFVGKPGQVYQVRFNLEASCRVQHEASGHVAELFVGAPCRSEYTIASRNLFQIPTISKQPSDEQKDTPVARKLSEIFQDCRIDIRTHREHHAPRTNRRWTNR